MGPALLRWDYWGLYNGNLSINSIGIGGSQSWVRALRFNPSATPKHASFRVLMLTRPWCSIQSPNWWKAKYLSDGFAFNAEDVIQEEVTTVIPNHESLLIPDVKAQTVLRALVSTTWAIMDRPTHIDGIALLISNGATEFSRNVVESTSASSAWG